MQARTAWALITVTAGAAGLMALLAPGARRARQRTRPQEPDDSRRVDEASEESFPASDPPSFSAPAATTDVRTAD